MPRAWYTSDRVLTSLKRLAVFAAVIVAYLLLRNVPVLHATDAWAQHQFVRFGTAIGGVVSRVIASDASLSARLDACEENRMALTAENAALQTLEREVAELESLLEFSERTTIDGIAARVLSRSVGGTSTVTVDRGSNEGVAEGMAAVIGDGILYGTVDRVAEHTSVIRLTTDRSSAIPAAVLNKRRTIGLVRGQEGAILMMDFVPQDAVIDMNDIVVTSGLDGGMPEGLILGTVSDVVAQESAPFKQAIIEPVHDPREWSTMLIVALPENL